MAGWGVGDVGVHLVVEPVALVTVAPTAQGAEVVGVVGAASREGYDVVDLDAFLYLEGAWGAATVRARLRA